MRGADPGFATFGLHQRASNAHKASVGYASLERTDKTGAKNIAGSFSGDQGYRQRAVINH
jgi:hypothetical protein